MVGEQIAKIPHNFCGLLNYLQCYLKGSEKILESRLTLNLLWHASSLVTAYTGVGECHSSRLNPRVLKYF